MKLKFKYLFISLLGMSLLLFNNTYTVKASENKYLLFPDNSETQLKAENASDFYRNHNIEDYQEFNNAEVNIREKVLYEKTNTIIEKRLKAYEHYVWLFKQQNNHDNVSPKRQIYLFSSLKIDKKGTSHFRFAIVDVETQKVLTVGRHDEL